MDAAFGSFSCLSRWRARRRRTAKFSGAWSLRTRLRSSFKATSRTQCSLFSIDQCLRTAWSIRSALPSKLEIRYSANCDGDNIYQLVISCPILARISHFAKMFFNRFQRFLRHGYLLRVNQFYLILDAIALAELLYYGFSSSNKMLSRSLQSQWHIFDC